MQRKPKGADQLRGYAQLICAFLFTYTKSRFIHEAMSGCMIGEMIYLGFIYLNLVGNIIWMLQAFRKSEKARSVPFSLEIGGRVCVNNLNEYYMYIFFCDNLTLSKIYIHFTIYDVGVSFGTLLVTPYRT